MLSPISAALWTQQVGKVVGKALAADRQLLLFTPFKSPICNDQPPREESEAEGRRRGGIEFLIVQHLKKKQKSQLDAVEFKSVIL